MIGEEKVDARDRKGKIGTRIVDSDPGIDGIDDVLLTRIVITGPIALTPYSRGHLKGLRQSVQSQLSGRLSICDGTIA